ncbi:MAG: DUF3365 domain-containing protein [Deferrisomatales bacterium]|nr:DUF3365 domain-containing protein [Deferrisomatales bacterium]
MGRTTERVDYDEQALEPIKPPMQASSSTDEDSMQRVFATLVAIGVALGAARAGAEDAQVAEARQAVQTLASQLKEALGSALQQGGVDEAIRVCQREAQGLAAKVSAATGWEVARTSTRYRNPANAPDPWERRVLAGFEARRAAGEAPETLEFSEWVETGGTRMLRYMKAIPTGQVCLGCHGTTIAPKAAAALREAYPEDRATGFSAGELRGAFTLKKGSSGECRGRLVNEVEP